MLAPLNQPSSPTNTSAQSSGGAYPFQQQQTPAQMPQPASFTPNSGTPTPATMSSSSGLSLDYKPFDGGANPAASQPGVAASGLTPTAANAASNPLGASPTGLAAMQALGANPNAAALPVNPETGATYNPTAVPTAMPGGTPGAPGAGGNLGYGSSSTFGPGNDLTNQEITPNGPTDREGLANQYLDTYKGQLLNQLQGDAKQTVSNNAALGRLGSGELNTSLGNLDLQAQKDYNATAANVLTNAANQQIGDEEEQRNELRQERANQEGEQQTAFNQGESQLGLQDQLTNDAFNRAYEENAAGQANNPASIGMQLAQMFGGMANQAGGNLGQMIQGTQMNNALQANQGQMMQYLQQIFGGGAGYPAAGGSPGGSAPPSNPAQSPYVDWTDPSGGGYDDLGGFAP